MLLFKRRLNPPKNSVNGLTTIFVLNVKIFSQCFLSSCGVPTIELASWAKQTKPKAWFVPLPATTRKASPSRLAAWDSITLSWCRLPLPISKSVPSSPWAVMWCYMAIVLMNQTAMPLNAPKPMAWPLSRRMTMNWSSQVKVPLPWS